MIGLEDGVWLGIYEKALVGDDLITETDWKKFLEQVPAAGFHYVDISVDETPEREGRLNWDQARRRMVRHAAEDVGAMLGGLCLSVHRKIGPGSADPEIRDQARQVMDQGIQLCHDLDIGLLQVAGYYAYYEQPHPEAKKWYTQMLADAVAAASRLGVVLGIENVDGNDVTSIQKVMQFVHEIDSPYLQAYPDLGNIAEQGLDPATELAAGRGHMVAIHAKDVRRGEPRRIEMGAGIVDWDTSFRVLADQRWSGRMMIEMWNDNASDSVERCNAARIFLTRKLEAAGIPVIR